MIVRDQYGIVLQQPVDINSADDSLARDSIMAFSGDANSIEALKHWESMGGKPARHPYTYPSNKYEGVDGDRRTTRDQLIPYVNALNKLGKYDLAEQVRKEHGFLVNKDPIAPDLKWMIAKAAKHPSQYLWMIPGFVFVIFSIFWSALVDPYIMVPIRKALKAIFPKKDINTNEHELNQVFCETETLGRGFTRAIQILHPNWKRNLEDYWGVHPASHGAWRQMPELAVMFIAELEKSI
jgi:hypothetical protein